MENRVQVEELALFFITSVGSFTYECALQSSQQVHQHLDKKFTKSLSCEKRVARRFPGEDSERKRALLHVHE